MTSALSHNLLLLFSPLAIGEEFAVIGDLDTWDRDPLDAHSEEAFLRFCRVHSTIACGKAWEVEQRPPDDVPPRRSPAHAPPGVPGSDSGSLSPLDFIADY